MTNIRKAIIGAAAICLIVGCKNNATHKTDNTHNYKDAIDAFYSATPVCLFSHPQQFPTQVAASDSSQTAPFAALVDQGLLARSTSEKRIVIVSKRETNYDLTDKGRSDWTADSNQPGYGNFCYGHRSVQSIDNSTTNNGQPGATTVVNYHYTVSGAPDWIKSQEMQNAFPDLQQNLSGGTATATLTDTNNGWKVTTPPPSSMGNNQPTTPADGKIVQ